jgi:predicted Zn-dependent peptidase
MASPEDQQSFVLPNGLKVVLVERPFGKGFTACLNFRAGRQDDPPDAIGVAHLTEHLVFTGKTRALSRELCEQSVYVNAATAQQRTAFYVSGHCDFLNEGLRLLASILEVRDVDSEACLHERQIVHQEMVDGEPDTLCGRNTAYWKLSLRLIGDPNWRSDYQQRMASVKNLTSDAVNAFRKEFYRLDKAALAIVAPCAHGELRRMIDDLFGTISPSHAAATPKIVPCAWQEAPEISFHIDRWPNIWVYVINTAIDSRVVTRLAADMLAHHLGGGQHSEMYGRFRENSATAYRATTEYECWIDRTSITSFVSVHKKSAVDALKFLIERGQQFADEGIDAKQRECLIYRTRRSWEMRMENHYHLADFLSFEALRSEGTSMVDLRPDAFEATTKEQFNAAARQLFDPRHRKIFIGGSIGWLGRRRIRNEISCLSSGNS